MNERYKRYCTTLIGKLTTEQFLQRFKGENESKFTSIKTENEKYWILNTTKLIFYKFKDWFSTNTKTALSGSLYYSLYMHKKRDFVVLKAPIMGFSLSSKNNTNNNIRYYLKNILKEMGYTQFEFDLSQTNRFGEDKFNTLFAIKILIPKEKNEEDLSFLLLMLDNFNNYVFSQNSSIWEDAIKIQKFVKFDYHKTNVDC